MVGFFNPDKVFWAEVYFDEHLTEEDCDKRIILIRSALREGKPIFGSSYHSSLDNNISNRAIDFIITGCNEEFTNPSQFKVQAQLWGDYDEIADISSCSVKFAFLNAKNTHDGTIFLSDVNYATLIQTNIVELNPTW